MLVLVAILALICIGAFLLLNRIVDFGANGRPFYGITSPEANQAMLQAYEQLSNELARWGALIGVLGAFFGLVLPVGGYLLQVKAVERYEGRVEKAIQKERARLCVKG